MIEDRHYGGYKYRNKRNKSTHLRNSFWGTVISAIAGTVVKDLTSDNSKIKKLITNTVLSKKITARANSKRIIEAEYKIINDDKDHEQNIVDTKQKQKIIV
jgi:hypothetical protein